MRYHVLLPAPGRPHPLYLSRLDADDDDQARRLVAATWPGEDLRLVREEETATSAFGVRFAPVPYTAGEEATEKSRGT
jgi:hypothetical protein